MLNSKKSPRALYCICSSISFRPQMLCIQIEAEFEWICVAIVEYSDIEVVITMHDERFADGMADFRSTAENNKLIYELCISICRVFVCRSPTLKISRLTIATYAAAYLVYLLPSNVEWRTESVSRKRASIESIICYLNESSMLSLEVNAFILILCKEHKYCRSSLHILCAEYARENYLSITIVISANSEKETGKKRFVCHFVNN